MPDTNTLPHSRRVEVPAPLPIPDQSTPAEFRASWSGVFAMSLCVFVLVASEFMPISLLTPVAADLAITEGQAGQAIAVSGAFAVLTSLFIPALAGRRDRKAMLLWMTALMGISGAVIGFAPNFATYMLGRVFVGIAIGGFWTMSAATAMRLVPGRQVPRALAIFNGGNALATVIAAPAGSYLGSIIGWRGAFLCLVPIAVAAFVWLLSSLPPMRAERAAGRTEVFKLLMRREVALGMASVSVFFMGQLALFTYLRPFLETVTGVDASTLSLLLLGLGLAGFLGTATIGAFLRNGLYKTLITIPAVMAIIALALIAWGGGLVPTAGLLALWGLLGTAAPVGWWSWVARTLPQEAEAAGGLMVAVIQLAIAAGSAVGGILFDHLGYRTTFAASATLLAAAAVLAFLTSRR